jgi:hypothetical protein
LSGTSILSWDETAQPTVTAVSAGSTSAQTWYGSVGLTGKSFRILGYVESTQATAGTWASTPSKIQLFGPGQKKPEDRVKIIYTSGTGSVSISPTSACDVIRFNSSGVLIINNATANITFSRNATILITQVIGVTGAALAGGLCGIETLDLPNTTAATTYSIANSAGVLTTQQCIAEELFI